MVSRRVTFIPKYAASNASSEKDAHTYLSSMSWVTLNQYRLAPTIEEAINQINIRFPQAPAKFVFLVVNKKVLWVVWQEGKLDKLEKTL